MAGDGSLLLVSSKYIVVSYKPFITAKALLIANGIVAAYGEPGDLRGAAKSMGADIVEYSYPILPGFIDAHMHLDGLGVTLASIDLNNARSIDEIGELLIRGPRMRLGEWIIARGFDHELLAEKRMPTRRDLDKFVKDRPVLLIHRSGHMGVLNSAGMDIVLSEIGLTELGRIDLEKGLLYEDSLVKVYEHVKKNISALDYIDIYRSAIRHLLAHGVTSIGIAGCTSNCLKGLRLLNSTGELDVRTHIYMYYGDTSLDYVASEALDTWRRDSMIKINGLKIFADGALGTHTAYLSKPYSDKPDTRGVELLSSKKIEEILVEASRLGLQVAVHAIGDAALDNVLWAYRRHESSVKRLRHRIEHASLVRPDQMALIRKLRPVVVVQPRFVIADTWLLDRVGEERVRWCYPFKSLYEATITAFSTDAPVEPVNPWETIYAAITRGSLDSIRHGSLTMEESLGLIESLDAYTRGSSYAVFNDRIGCLRPGCRADFIVVDRDIFTISGKDIRSVRVLAAFVDGKMRYSTVDT